MLEGNQRFSGLFPSQYRDPKAWGPIWPPVLAGPPAWGAWICPGSFSASPSSLSCSSAQPQHEQKHWKRASFSGVAGWMRGRSEHSAFGSAFPKSCVFQSHSVERSPGKDLDWNPVHGGQDQKSPARMLLLQISASSNSFFLWDKNQFPLVGDHGLTALPFVFRISLWSQERNKKGDTEQDPISE